MEIWTAISNDIMFDDLIDNLEFVSTIQPNEKICLKNKTRVSSFSWSGSISRYWSNQSRNQTVHDLNYLVDICNRIHTNLSLGQLQILKDAISSSLLGIQNLINTYHKDGSIVMALIQIKSQFEDIRTLTRLRYDYLSLLSDNSTTI